MIKIEALELGLIEELVRDWPCQNANNLWFILFQGFGGFERGVVQTNEGLRRASLREVMMLLSLRTRLGRLVEETVDASRQRLSSAYTVVLRQGMDCYFSRCVAFIAFRSARRGSSGGRQNCHAGVDTVRSRLFDVKRRTTRHSPKCKAGSPKLIPFHNHFFFWACRVFRQAFSLDRSCTPNLIKQTMPQTLPVRSLWSKYSPLRLINFPISTGMVPGEEGVHRRAGVHQQIDSYW